MAQQIAFDVLIIDEATRAIELRSLIPLRYRQNIGVPVGDPQQLPLLSTEVSITLPLISDLN